MEIEIKTKALGQPTDFSWQLGMGNDHFFQLLRKDVIEQIKFAHEELGIKYLRCHGIFDDDMNVYERLSDFSKFGMMPYKDELKEINFHQVALGLNNLLATGVKPFMELSFMPSALAKKNKYGLRYNNNTSLPKSLEEWSAFIETFFNFLLSYYGKEEVESWYFEVWNEPDLDGFFSGSQEDYFALYETTAKAIKKVDSSLRVGGPSTSACKWLKEFIPFCEKNQVPLDFVSTHHYPGDAFGNILTMKDSLNMMKKAKEDAKEQKPLSDVMADLFFRPDLFKKWDRGTLAKMDRKAKEEAGKYPLFITEWNSMATFGSLVHDEKFSSAFVIKSVMDNQSLTSGYMFWCVSDIFEELFMLNQPFHGGYGIINNDGIPKPNFWAFKILSSLYPERLVSAKTDGKTEYALFRQKENIQVLIYSQDQDYYAQEEEKIHLRLDGTYRQAFISRIDDMHTNPKALWEKGGRKSNLTLKEVEAIKEKSRLKREKLPVQEKEQTTEVELTIKSNDVAFLEFIKED